MGSFILKLRACKCGNSGKGISNFVTHDIRCIIVIYIFEITTVKEKFSNFFFSNGKVSPTNCQKKMYRRLCVETVFTGHSASKHFMINSNHTIKILKTIKTKSTKKLSSVPIAVIKLLINILNVYLDGVNPVI